MSGSLWPNFASMSPPRGMMEMLRDLAGDIDAQTGGKVDFYIDPVGVGISGAVQHIRYNCYLRVVKNNYTHLLFRVTTPVASPFPATAETPEGERFSDLKTEDELRHAVSQVLQRQRTQEVVLYLLATVR